MSLIKKALEKARQERKLFLGENQEYKEGTDSSLSDGAVSSKTKAAVGAALGMLEVPPPTYSETRSVLIEPEKLIDRKVFSILEKDEVADQYKLLRTMVLNRTRPLGHNTIEITSFKNGEGKSLTCVNLAISLAKESRQNVLLVDADLRRPSIHSILGIDPNPGLKDYFLNNVPLKDILIHPGIERLTVLPAGGRMDNSTEIIGSTRAENLIRQLKSRYQDRYIIFDTPALSTCSDPLILSSHVDAILLVARANRTTAEDITSGMALLKDKNILGTVLNDSDIRKGWTY